MAEGVHMNNAENYSKIVSALRKEILGGKYLSPHSQFPSERALARRFDVNRSVITRVLQDLSAKGFLVRKQGKGTFLTAGAQRSGGAIGLIVPGVAYSEFFSLIVSSVSRLAQKEERTLLFGDISSRDPEVRVRQAKRFAEKLVADGAVGVLYQPLEFVRDTEKCNREIVSIFTKAKIPVVLVDCDIVKPPRRSEFDLVGINNESAGGRLAELLMEKGARNIHFLMHSDRSPNMHKRVNGVMGAIVSRGRKPSGWSCSHIIDANPEDTEKIRRHIRRHRPDAIVCGTDMTAALLKHTLEKIGVRVPDDILLAGIDGTKTSSIMSPQLTTIHQPCEQIAETAFYRLLRRIVNPNMPPTEFLLSAPLRERASTMRIAGPGKTKGRPKRKGGA